VKEKFKRFNKKNNEEENNRKYENMARLYSPIIKM